VAVLDLVFLGVLAVSLLLGLWRGLTYEIVSLAAWGVAFVAAQWLAPWMAGKLPLGGTSEPVRHAAGFGVVFVVTLFAGGLLAVLAKRLMHAVGLSPMDRALGAAFGLTRGLVVLLAFAVVVNLTALKEGLWWRESVGAGVLTIVLQGLKPVMPVQFGSYLP
jgi:membrane protein required for colicin V production